jgi:hypothetical protein
MYFQGIWPEQSSYRTDSFKECESLDFQKSIGYELGF